MSGYPTSTSLLRVDGLSTDLRVLGHHNDNQINYDINENELLAIIK